VVTAKDTKISKVDKKTLERNFALLLFFVVRSKGSKKVKKSFWPVLAVIVLVIIPLQAAAQSDTELVLRLNRNFGYSSGMGAIQGAFTMKAAGPQELDRVVFYIDSQAIGEVSQPPFDLRFHTDAYDLGQHRLYALGYTGDGRELRSNEIQVEFVSAEAGWQAGMRIALPILVIVFGMMAVSFVMMFVAARQAKSLPPGTARNYGAAGGAICPRCQRPFSRHVLAPNLLVGKLERCPFCGKWSVLPARQLAELRAAEAAELASAQGEARRSADDEDERLRRELEDSRYV